MNGRIQIASGRRLFLIGAVTAAFAPAIARADGELDPRGASFRDFAVFDHGSSFSRIDPMIGSGANPTQSRILAIDNNGGFALIRFDSIRIEMAMPLGWQASEDWERGVGFSGDKSFRLIVWRVDFGFEGVDSAEHYAATKAGTIQSRRRGVQAQVRKLPDGAFLIIYRNVPPAQGDGQPRAVFDLVVPRPGKPKEGVLMTLGVPASEADRGLLLMALLKQKLRIDW